MSDCVDDANDMCDLMLSATLANRDLSRLPATGSCLNCCESLPDGGRFCDADCRDDYEKREFMKYGR